MAKPLDVKQLRDPTGATGHVLTRQPDGSMATEASLGAVGAQVAPGVIPVLGTFQGWTGSAKLAAQAVFYTRIFLQAATYDRMEVAFVGGTGSGKTCDLGVYADDGGSPTPSPTGALLQSIGPLDTNTFDHKLFTKSLTSNLVVATAAYHWFAVVVSAGGMKLVSSPNKFDRLWRDRLFAFKSAYGSATLGALSGFDAASELAIPYIAILEQ